MCYARVVVLRSRVRNGQVRGESWPTWRLWKAVTPQEASGGVRGKIKTNTIFSRLSFNNNFPSIRASDEERSARMKRCAFIRQEAPGWSTADLLGNHPIAQRSFATFPALTDMRILNIDECHWDRHVRNVAGITVHDFLLTLSET